MTVIKIQYTKALSDRERQDLFSLHSRFFRNVKKDLFFSDLAEKDYIITSKESNKPIAFSTIKLHHEVLDGKKIVYIFSGDTIVHPDYWQQNILVPGFAAFLNYMIETSPATEVYWFLTTKGYRTYLFMPVFFKTFYPCPGISTPDDMKKILFHIAHRRFNNHFHEDKGLVCHNGDRDALVDELCLVPEAKQNNRFVKFFLEKNPGFADGDELACITRISRENIKPIGLKIIEFKDMVWEI